MKKLLRKMMISCLKSTELMEKRTLFGLTFYEKMNLFLHKSMCDACRAYEKQSKQLDNFLGKHIHDADEKDVPLVVNNDLKKDIISNL